MITVISGTNRTGAKTHIFAKKYAELLKEHSDEDVRYFSLENLPQDFYHNAMYAEAGQSKDLGKIQDEQLLAASKWVIFSPEYNGSYPGILKLFIDAISIRNYKGTFVGKKVALLGVASGRAGNLRGMDHLTGIFNHVGATVFPNKLPISQIGGVLSEEAEINEATVEVLKGHITSFLAF